MDANTENRFFGAAKRDVVAGLQFAFDLPYKGYFNVAPLVYWEFSNHNSFPQCNSAFSGLSAGRELHHRRQHLLQADLGGGNQLLHGSRLPAADIPVLLDQRPRRPGMARRVGHRTAAVQSSVRRLQHRSRVQLGADPSDLRRLQGLLGPEVHALRRHLGRLSLLAEQVRPRPQPGLCLHYRCRRRHREQQLLHRNLAVLRHHGEVLISSTSPRKRAGQRLTASQHPRPFAVWPGQYRLMPIGCHGLAADSYDRNGDRKSLRVKTRRWAMRSSPGSTNWRRYPRRPSISRASFSPKSIAPPPTSS